MISRERQVLEGMEGMILGQMRAASMRGRWGGQFRVQWDEDAWLLLWLPPGANRAGWSRGGAYLMSETSGKPRRFKKADTVLRLVERSMTLAQIVVYFGRPETGPGSTRDDAELAKGNRNDEWAFLKGNY